MSQALAVLVSLLAAASGVLVALYIWTAFTSHIRPDHDQVLHVTTADGHMLPLHRHLPRPAAGPPRGAVLCLHGLGANHFNLDLPGKHSLARWLADAGHDVFVASFRGDPGTRAPGGPNVAVSFDQVVNLDMRAVLDAVKATSGFEQIHLVGHSMGGLVAYAAAVVHGQADLASIVAVGSPVGFVEREAVLDGDTAVAALVHALPVVPVRWLGKMAVPFLGFLATTRRLARQYNAEHCDLAVLSRAMWNALSNVSRGVALQFEDWIKNDAFRSQDGTVDYREGLRALTVPLMVVAGSMDPLARPVNAQRAADLAASLHKEVVVMGPDEGTAPYGHLDLIFGEAAPQDVFARIQRFLEAAADSNLGITSRDVGQA